MFGSVVIIPTSCHNLNPYGLIRVTRILAVISEISKAFRFARELKRNTSKPMINPPCKFAQSKNNKGRKNLNLFHQALSNSTLQKKAKKNQLIICGLIPKYARKTAPA